MPCLSTTLTVRAREQDGLLTATQLRSAGLSKDAISRRARDWQPVLRGVYLVEHRPIDESVRAMAAVLKWPAAVLSHQTAARRRGWKLLQHRPDWGTWLSTESADDQVVHLTSETQVRTPVGYRLHRAHRGDWCMVGRSPVTDEVRTLADIARTAPLPQAVCLIDAVCRTDAALFDELQRALNELAGHRGAQRAQRVYGLAHPGAESALETLLRLLLVLAGLPPPEVQVAVRHPGGVYYGDLGYRDRKLILEADGRDYHSEWDQVMKDMSRQNLLVAAGWTVLRFSWRQVLYQPELVLRAVAQALAA